MKAVKGHEGGGVVVDLDEPPGMGEVLDMAATSVCASDISYLRFGTTHILGHELAGRSHGPSTNSSVCGAGSSELALLGFVTPE